jgi:two-component system sensor histidine kinase KdpD
MTDFTANEDLSLRPRAGREEPGVESFGMLPPAGRYAVALLLVAAATLLAFVAEHVVAGPNLTLIYVLPVVIAATAFGWGPAIAAAGAGVLAFDFFFTEPRFSLRIYSAADIWAAVLLLAIATIVASVAAQSRARALEARLAADRSQALQALAQVVIDQRPQAEILDAAAKALHRIFRAPAVIFVLDGSALRRAATAGAPEIAPLDEEAARGAISAQLHTRAQTYPYDQAEFEFWPVATPAGGRCALGVDFTHASAERPEQPEQFTEVVAAYVAVALAGARS